MKTIVITGASRGIGKVLAEKFLNEGHYVIGTSITGKSDLVHKNLKIVALDLLEPKSIQSCAEEIKKVKDKIDIYINNAGALFDDGETHLHIDKLRQTLEVNLIGTADLTERLVPSLVSGSHLLFLSSSAGSISEADYHTHSHHPNQYPAYKISKAALNMYMRTLAMRFEHEEKGITVSSVHPGWVKTDMGGEDAPTLPEEAAEDIYKLATSKVESGYFWYKGKKYPW